MGLAPASVETTKSRHFILAARIYVNFQKVDEEKPLGFGLLTAIQEEKTA